MSKIIDIWEEEGTTYSILILEESSKLTIIIDPPFTYTGRINDDVAFRSWNFEMNMLLNDKLLNRIKYLKSVLETL